jgi:curved DNA-binding protein CbpA
MDATQIRALARMLDRMDYYKLLRVEQTANATEIRDGFHKLRRLLHGDRYLNEDDETRDAVDRISKRINEAYVVLRGSRRPTYDKALAQGTLRYSDELESSAREESEADKGRTPNGRRFFAMVVEDERRGDKAKALANLKMALTFEPQNPAFKKKLEELQAAQAAASPASAPARR